MDTALPNIHLDTNTMEEIRNALAVGKEVTTHTDPVSVPGYTGAGYVIIDPDTGIGAYKIGGGMNGGWLLLFVGMAIALLFLITVGVPLLFAIAASSVTWWGLAISSIALNSLIAYWLADEDNFLRESYKKAAEWLGWLSTGLTVAFPDLVGIVVTIMSYLFIPSD